MIMENDLQLQQPLKSLNTQGLTMINDKSNHDISNNGRPVKRRIRMALSCQRCRKHRSKCSRQRPMCEQCLAAGVECEYLDLPGDLESTALRDRFQGLEEQIHSLTSHFKKIEDLVQGLPQQSHALATLNAVNTVTIIPTNTTTLTNSITDIPRITNSDIQINSLSNWTIYPSTIYNGLSIDTNMFHVTDIYSTLLQFAKDNLSPQQQQSSYPAQQNLPDNGSSEIDKPIWLIRNKSLFPNVKFSHFTSLRPIFNEDDDEYLLEKDIVTTSTTFYDNVDDTATTVNNINTLNNMLSITLIQKIFTLYKDCLLYGAVQPFDTLFKELFLVNDIGVLSPQLQLLYASIIAHMLPHTFYWHPEIFQESTTSSSLPLSLFNEETCIHLSLQYYKFAKRLLSSIYFDTPSLITCHAICNLVLYHMENGNTSVIYIYSGMAVRMALSLQLYREDSLESIVKNECDLFPGDYKPAQNVGTVKQYARSLLWFMYFLDTASSHYHNKPYEIHLDDHVSTTTLFTTITSTATDQTSQLQQQDEESHHHAFFQYIEFITCQITREIRRALFTTESLQTPYREIELIEKRLLDFQKQLPKLEDVLSNSPISCDSIWKIRLIKQWIRHYGHWILLHQSFIPTPISIQRCTTAAFALVELFVHWSQFEDCYFRPCVHELKQACEILLWHVVSNTDTTTTTTTFETNTIPIVVNTEAALQGLVKLVHVLLNTPVGEIAKTRPFVQRVLKVLQAYNSSNKK